MSLALLVSLDMHLAYLLPNLRPQAAPYGMCRPGLRVDKAYSNSPAGKPMSMVTAKARGAVMALAATRAGQRHGVLFTTEERCHASVTKIV